MFTAIFSNDQISLQYDFYALLKEEACIPTQEVA